MAKVTSKTHLAAHKFFAAAFAAGFHVTARENIVTITKRFTPGSQAEFVAIDQEYYSILSMVPARGGSMWGTDGSGVGGYSAILHGLFQMNISGVNKSFIAALS